MRCNGEGGRGRGLAGKNALKRGRREGTGRWHGRERAAHLFLSSPASILTPCPLSSCRYDDYAFERIADSAFGRSARAGRLEQVTFLRMGDLMFDNWDAFSRFLQRMRNQLR